MANKGIIVAVIVTLLCGLSVALETINMGGQERSACREANATLAWTLPPDVGKADFTKLWFTSVPTPDDPNPDEINVMSRYREEDWKINAVSTRFRGRIFNTSSTSFMLENSLKHDRGTYRLEVITPQNIYEGKIDFIIFHEDNLYPRSASEGNSSDVAETVDGETQYTYRFIQPDDSPAIGMQMRGSTSERKGKPMSCYFGNDSSCEIVFTPKAGLKDLNGTVNLETTTIFKKGTPVCTEVSKPFYSLQITITVLPSTGLATTALGAVIGAAVLVVAVGCVVPPLISRNSKKRYKQVPLSKGLDFVKFCTGVISKYQDPSDLSAVYRQNKPADQIVAFIRTYLMHKEDFDGKKKTKKSREDDEDDEMGRAQGYKDERLLMAGAIKHFLKQESTPWLPLELQRNVVFEEGKYSLKKGELDVEQIKDLLNDESSKTAIARRDILKHLLEHFKWLSDLQKTLQRQSNVVDIKGIATCVGPNLFKEGEQEYVATLEGLEVMDRTQKAHGIANVYNAYLVKLIENVSDIFPETTNKLKGPQKGKDISRVV